MRQLTEEQIKVIINKLAEQVEAHTIILYGSAERLI
jgi:hypothetical protein